MADHTHIEWCDSTFNPWIGCTKVSPACDHCYASVSTPARALGVEWGVGQPRRRTSPSNWKLPLRWNRADGIALNAWEGFKAQYPGLTDAQMEAKGFIKPRRRRVFCASLADVFDNEVDPVWRRDLFELILRTPHLDWLLLTKRIGNVMSMLVQQRQHHARYEAEWRFSADWIDGRPPPNVWLGATICNQAEATRDIPKLLSIPARVRFVSMEPLLAPVDLLEHLARGCIESGGSRWNPRSLGWVIAGGESGPGARPMHPEWIRDLRDQCAAAGVPFMFKQWGEWAPADIEAGGDLGGDLRRGVVRHLHAPGNPEGHFRAGDAYVRRLGKKAAGRLLDGQLHDGYPSGGSC